MNRQAIDKFGESGSATQVEKETILQASTTEDGLKLVNNNWDAEQKRIQNVSPGVELSDVSTVAQSCTYDSEFNNFRCGTRTFNLVQSSSNCPILCAKYNNEGVATMSDYETQQEVRPRNLLYFEPNTFKLKDHIGTEIVWDEQRKRFCESFYVPWRT